MNALICPVCQSPLTLTTEKQLCCEQQHSFDRARQGYFNLLLSHKKRSKSPGDSAEMVVARQRFLDSGFYYPISDAINQLAGAALIKAEEPISLADIGCGEGYYTVNMAQYLANFEKAYEFYGIDISKEAIISASKRDKQLVNWLVASGNQMPIADQSLDLATCLFTRLMPEEFHRVLKEDGLLITVNTGEQHLIELREILYDTIKPSFFSPEKVLSEHFELVEEQEVKYQNQLESSEQIQDLLLMTPHHWRATAEKKAELFAYQSLTITVDAQIHIFKRR